MTGCIPVLVPSFDWWDCNLFLFYRTSQNIEYQMIFTTFYNKYLIIVVSLRNNLETLANNLFTYKEVFVALVPVENLNVLYFCKN